MTDLTSEKWQELADKLTLELAAAEIAAKLARRKGMRYLLAAPCMGAVALTLAFVGRGGAWGMIAAFPALLLCLFAGAYGMRQFRIATLGRDDIDRIHHDIRLWKKKKPATSGG